MGEPSGGCCINALGVVGCNSGSSPPSLRLSSLDSSFAAATSFNPKVFPEDFSIAGNLTLPGLNTSGIYHLTPRVGIELPYRKVNMVIQGQKSTVDLKVERLDFFLNGNIRTPFMSTTYLSVIDSHADITYYNGLIGVLGPSVSFRPKDCVALPAQISGCGYVCAQPAAPAPPSGKLNEVPFFVGLLGPDKGLTAIFFVAPFKFYPPIGTPENFSAKGDIPAAQYTICDKYRGGLLQVYLQSCAVITDPALGKWVISCASLLAGFRKDPYGRFVIPLNPVP